MAGAKTISTDFLLLGLLREGVPHQGGVASQVLGKDLGLDLDKLRDVVMARHRDEPGPEATSSNHIPFSVRSKKVLELSLREGLQLGHNYIGTEHLLLGLLHEGNGSAAEVLRKDCGLELTAVRLAVIRRLSVYPLMG